MSQFGGILMRNIKRLSLVSNRRLSIFTKSLAGFLSVFSVGRSSAESFLKKFRRNFPKSNGRLHEALVQESPFHFSETPIQNPFALHQLDGAALKIAGDSELLQENVSRHMQSIEGAAIRGTWVQTITNATGEKIFEAGELVDSVPRDIREKAKALFARKAEAIDAFNWGSAEFRHASWAAPPELEIVITPDQRFTFEWSVDFMSADETASYRAFLDEHFKFLGVKAIGSHLIEGIGAVYPKGPKDSLLENLPLHNLNGSGRLTSETLDIKTGAAQVAASANLDFRFQPDDTRFDQVQAYFFADQALKFFKSHFDAAPLYQVEIKVQVGDHSNAAYYFSNRIRVGQGDGVKYQNLAQDPSVIMHEVGHALVDRYSGLPSDGEGGSLNEAFADYFAATISDNARLGESSYLAGPFVRTLANNLRAPNDLGTGLYRSSQVVSGSLWDLRCALGQAVADQLAFRTLARVGAGATFKDFAPSVLAAADALPLDLGQKSKAIEVLKARGWDL